jgi:hypothetical protein
MIGINDTSCTLMSLLVSDLENLNCLIFVAQMYVIFSNILENAVSNDISL